MEPEFTRNRSGGLSPARGRVAPCTPVGRIALSVMRIKMQRQGRQFIRAQRHGPAVKRIGLVQHRAMQGQQASA